MCTIRPIGGYFPLDEEGHLINPCREKLLPASCRPLLRAIITIYREEAGGSLHSVWIRGSLPRGLAVAGSDTERPLAGRRFNRFFNKSSKTEADIRQLTKVILRAGFELVMEREREYTPDLYWCYQAFAKWYPEYRRNMYAVLEAFLEPASSDEERLRQIAGVGKWLIAELQRQGISGNSETVEKPAQ